MVLGPGALSPIKQLQGFPEFPLFSRCFEYADGPVGSLMKGGITDDDLDLAGKGLHGLLDEWRERRTGLARGIGKFDDVDLGVVAAERGRMRPNKCRGLLLGHKTEFSCPLIFVIRGSNKENRD